MEVDWVYSLCVSVIMLEESLRSWVKDFDLLVCWTWSNHWACWIISNLIDHTCMICDLSQLSASLSVPELYTCVITSRDHSSWVRAKSTCSDPVLMSLNSCDKLLFSNVPKFKSLIISARNKQLAVTWKIEISNWSSMRLEHLGWSFNAVCPEPDSFIRWGRGDKISCRIYVNSVHRTCMRGKFEWAEVLFEIPNHDNRVVRACNKLF